MHRAKEIATVILVLPSNVSEQCHSRVHHSLFPSCALFFLSATLLSVLLVALVFFCSASYFQFKKPSVFSCLGVGTTLLFTFLSRCLGRCFARFTCRHASRLPFINHREQSPCPLGCRLLLHTMKQAVNGLTRLGSVRRRCR